MDSDTESEGEYDAPPATTSDAQFVLRQPQTTFNMSVSDAVRVLATTASRAASVGSDAELHDNVVAASSSLNAFLDGMLQADATQKLDICASFDIFSELLKVDFLQTLFTHRRAVYSILRALGDTHSISVPWTDVLLLKLCRIITLVSLGCTQNASPTQLLDAQALWAIRQLPQNLRDFSPAIYSTYASPGMRKLALQLVFGACIISPSVSGDPAPCDVIVSIADIESIARYYGDTAIRHADELSDGEKLPCAMAAVICTTFTTKRESDKPSPSRTYFDSLVFGCLQALFDTSQLSLFGGDALDSAQLVVLSWGDVLPWCWQSCTDPRSADMPLVSLLTALWLQNQDRGSTDGSWKSATLDLLMRDLPLSAMHILQLLYRVGNTLREGHGHVEAVAHLAHKVCWSMAQLSDPLLEGHIVFFPEAILQLCTIFLHYVSGGPAALNVVEAALNTLLNARPSDICAVAESLAEEHSFSSAFDRAVSSMRKSLPRSSEDVRSAQLLLALVTVFGHRDARLPCYRSTVTMLSSAISDHVCAGTESSRALAASFAIAAPYLGVGGRALSEEEVLCLLYPEQTQSMGASHGLNLICVAAVSDYLLCSSSALQSMSTLLKAEVFDALRDALTLTIGRRFVGEDEAMSVLVAPLIARALSRLSACGDTVFAEHAIGSSWTQSLRSHLETAVQRYTSRDSDLVRTALRAGLAPNGHITLDLTNKAHTHSQADTQVPCATRLVFHNCADFIFLVPTLTPEASECQPS